MKTLRAKQSKSKPKFSLGTHDGVATRDGGLKRQKVERIQIYDN